MGEVIYGVDFRKHLGQKEHPMAELAKEMMALVDALNLDLDTAPSELNPDADAS